MAEEILAETVRVYPILYDKRHAESDRKDIRRDGWNEIAENSLWKVVIMSENAL